MRIKAEYPIHHRRNLAKGNESGCTDEVLRNLKINTICASGKCPNKNECYSQRRAAFMILGTDCTRNCLYCSVSHGDPKSPDDQEPKRVAEAARILALQHIVITSVTRDDLKDGGVGQFIDTIEELRRINRDLIVEVLTPDFKNNQDYAVNKLIGAGIDIFNHNIETISRLHSSIRPQGGYDLSMSLLKKARELRVKQIIKSGVMLGFGESKKEVIDLLMELKDNGCEIITIGQYLKPSKNAVEVNRFLDAGEFDEYREIGYNIGFLSVESGAFVRSSYQTQDSFRSLKGSVPVRSR